MTKKEILISLENIHNETNEIELKQIINLLIIIFYSNLQEKLIPLSSPLALKIIDKAKKFNIDVDFYGERFLIDQSIIKLKKSVEDKDMEILLTIFSTSIKLGFISEFKELIDSISPLLEKYRSASFYEFTDSKNQTLH